VATFPQPVVSGYSVGEIAALIGVSPSTVRMWGRRYGLEASERSTGGHRRFTEEDLARLLRMQESVLQGESPSAAANPGRPRRPPARGGPGGPVLAVPGALPAARGLARAASRLDEPAAVRLLTAHLATDGSLRTWTEIVVPVLISAGESWADTGDGIEIEHLISQAVTAAFTWYSLEHEVSASGRPVLLAGGPQESHTLALVALRAALCERAVPTRMLGPRTPVTALTTAARQTRSAAALMWLSQGDHDVATALAAAPRHRGFRVFLGGPGWPREPSFGTWCPTLQDATASLEGTWRAQADRS
jgi:hypothetical protein